jgi:ribonucleoside-triphosphate reductase
MYPDYISEKKMKEHYDGNVFPCMGCRSFLSPWYDENGNPKFFGRANMGVVSLNLPRIGIEAKGDMDKFYKILDSRLELCFKALMFRYNCIKGSPSDVSPIHWQHGALARLKPGEKIDKLLENGYCSISLGYIGVYETTMLMTGVSHTQGVGKEFALNLMKYLKETCEKWKKETGLGFGLYGTPKQTWVA